VQAVGGHQFHLIAARGLQEEAGIVRRERRRLLLQHMLAGGHGAQRKVEVLIVGQRAELPIIARNQGGQLRVSGAGESGHHGHLRNVAETHHRIAHLARGLGRRRGSRGVVDAGAEVAAGTEEGFEGEEAETEWADFLATMTEEGFICYGIKKNASAALRLRKHVSISLRPASAQ